MATFGSDFNEKGDIFIGDKYNHVVRMINAKTNVIQTIAGDSYCDGEEPNDPKVKDPLSLRLPKIRSIDYFHGNLFVPTDISESTGDLAVLKCKEIS
jgi:hypothetical protein